jgi:hypothetical protein
MANLYEIQVKNTLFDLLMLQKKNEGIKSSGLSFLITKAKAGMSKEDVAYIKELVDKEADFL